MTEGAAKKTEEAAEEAAETIIELVEHVPLGLLLLAFALGGTLVFMAMIAVSKPPVTTPVADDAE